MSDWHQLDVHAAADRLGTDLARGLTAADAARLLTQHGPNELVERGGRSTGAIIRDQLTGTMVLVLIAAAVISAAIGDLLDASAIAAIVVLNAILGFSQESRAERAIGALRRLAVPHVRVRRDGTSQDISARDVVPGDLMLVEAGNIVAADGRVVESASLRTQEAALTGESESVDKSIGAVANPEASVADRRNMVFMGTSVTYGRGTVLVTATGMDTELGAIAASLQTMGRETTPLQRRLDALGRTLALAALGIVGVIFALGVFRGEELRLMVLTAVSMAGAAVPEGLPAVVTIALALGAQRMLKRHALIRKLSAVETLGSVTVICSDKTGTLTENRMRAAVLEVAGTVLPFGAAVPDLRRFIAVPSADVRHDDAADPAASLALLLAGSALCNDATFANDGSGDGEPRVVGDPTEAAFVHAAARCGLRKDELEAQFPRRGELPFDADRKRMTTVHDVGDGDGGLGRLVRRAGTRQNGITHVAFTKGAVDRLVEICSGVWNRGAVKPLDEGEREGIARSHDRLANDGMRVLGVAVRPLSGMPDDKALEQDLVFVGLVGLIDPPRAEAAQSVATCLAAGIRPVMITGDHPLTARYIASKLRIMSGDRVLTGADVNRMSDDELAAAANDVSVFARVSPQHKYRIVEAMQSRGQIVAMTGDGVNDAPALKKADIGVAMGITGTDVSKEAADTVLLDDNFATIVAAVEEGRTIYDNIRKFVKYLLTTNSGELLIMLVAPIAGMPLPLVPLQILWINLVTDGPTALTLGVEPPEPGVMHRPPRPPRESIFAQGLGRHVLWVGALMAAMTLGLGYWYWASGDAAWQTVVFTTLAFSQMAHVLAIRSSTASLFEIGLLSNPYLAGAVVLTIGLQLMLVYVGPLQSVFSTVPLAAVDLAACVAVAAVIFIAVEGEKWLIRRREGVRRVV